MLFAGFGFCQTQLGDFRRCVGDGGHRQAVCFCPLLEEGAAGKNRGVPASDMRELFAAGGIAQRPDPAV